MVNFLLLGLLIIAVFIILLTYIFKSPFNYPYYIYDFDISGKKNPDIKDLIDQLLIYNGFPEIQAHYLKTEHWKKQCQARIKRSILKKHRKEQYLTSVDDAHAYIFRLVRKQTRYKQRNYVRHSYKVNQITKEYSYSYAYLVERTQALAKIDYECTLKTYHSQNQRKLLTKELRSQIKFRDNYTCQLCGKYMPDEVGLHIDHIVPISKGGKSIPSNLQVLCSKCNGRKSNKT